MIRTKRTKLLDRSHNWRDAQLFVIATEGAKTEKQYFGMFYDSRIKVEVLATGEAGDSAPQHVIKRLNQFAQKYDFGEGDTLWLVLDVDRWGPENLSLVCREAQQKGYGLAISNPCFEVWLCLHLGDLNPEDRSCKDFKQRLKLELEGYNSSKIDTTIFQDHVQGAIDRAKSLHSDSTQNWPPTPGSHVYRVVDLIVKTISSASPEV
jgi:hypothetical protein